MFVFQLGIAFSVVFCIGLVIWLVGKECRWWSWPLVLAVAVLPQIGFAQDTVALADPAAALPVDPAAIQALIEAAGKSQWVLVLAIALSMVLGFVKWLLPRVLAPDSKVRLFSESRTGGWVLNLASSVIAAFISLATGHYAGVRIDPGLVISTLLGAVVSSLTAAGAYQFKKDFITKPKPVESPQAAASVLELPPRA